MQRMARRLTRRSVLGLLAVGASMWPLRRSLADPATSAGADDPDPGTLKPGESYWHPDRSPSGPVVIIVSIPKQLVFVYRNAVLIGVSTCSTGKPGHTTPTGVFTILDKAKVHTSSTYGEPMPDMEKLTWKGIALHVGDLPGYPDSHGCVHLPQDFADDLYGITQLGTPVIIAGSATDPEAIADPGPILGLSAAEVITEKVGKKALEAPGETAISILVSGADKAIYVLENGVVVAQGAASIKDPSAPIGSNVFVWRGRDANADPGSSWDGLAFQPEAGAEVAPSTAIIQRIDGAPEVMEAIRKLIKPGSVLVTTDLPSSPVTRSGTGFTVMDSKAG